MNAYLDTAAGAVAPTPRLLLTLVAISLGIFAAVQVALAAAATSLLATIGAHLIGQAMVQATGLGEDPTVREVVFRRTLLPTALPLMAAPGLWIGSNLVLDLSLRVS